jgi:hypothetical protein
LTTVGWEHLENSHQEWNARYITNFYVVLVRNEKENLLEGLNLRFKNKNVYYFAYTDVKVI